MTSWLVGYVACVKKYLMEIFLRENDELTTTTNTEGFNSTLGRKILVIYKAITR